MFFCGFYVTIMEFHGVAWGQTTKRMLILYHELLWLTTGVMLLCIYTRAEKVAMKNDPSAAALFAVIFAVVKLRIDPKDTVHHDTSQGSGEESVSDEEYGIELLGICYTNVQNNSKSTALLPTDHNRFSICDQCTFITRLEKYHKKRLVSNHRLYCTNAETQYEWSRFCELLIRWYETPDKQIMMSYGSNAKALMKHALTAKTATAKNDGKTVLESQYTPALYDVPVGVIPIVNVTKAATCSRDK